MNRGAVQSERLHMLVGGGELAETELVPIAGDEQVAQWRGLAEEERGGDGGEESYIDLKWGSMKSDCPVGLAGGGEIDDGGHGKHHRKENEARHSLVHAK